MSSLCCREALVSQIIACCQDTTENGSLLSEEGALLASYKQEWKVLQMETWRKVVWRLLLQIFYTADCYCVDATRKQSIDQASLNCLSSRKNKSMERDSHVTFIHHMYKNHKICTWCLQIQSTQEECSILKGNPSMKEILEANSVLKTAQQEAHANACKQDRWSTFLNGNQVTDSGIYALEIFSP